MEKLKERDGYTIVEGRYVRKIERNVKAKVKKIWLHMGKKTVVGKDVELSPTEYHFSLDRGLVDEATDQPRMIAASEVSS